MSATDWLPYADEFDCEGVEETNDETVRLKEEKGIVQAEDKTQKRSAADYRRRLVSADLDNIVKSCDAIYEGPTTASKAGDRRHRHHSQRERPSASWIVEEQFNRNDTVTANGRPGPSPSSPASASGSQHFLFRHLRWPLIRMGSLKKHSAGERPNVSHSPASPRKGSYQDLFNAAAAMAEGNQGTIGVYRLPPGSIAVRRLVSAPSPGGSVTPSSPPAGSKDRGQWPRRRKNGVDLGRLTMPLNSGEAVAALSTRCRHPSDHSVSQPVPVAPGGKQRHRSCYTPTTDPTQSPSSGAQCSPADVSCSSCASSVTEVKSRKSSGSSSASGGGGGGGGGGSGSGGPGSRIRSFIDNLRPRPKSSGEQPSVTSSHALGVAQTPPSGAGSGGSWLDTPSELTGSSVLHTIPQGQEWRHPPQSAPPPRHSAKERVVQSSSGAVKRPRSPSFGSAFVERLRSLSSSSASSIGAGGGGGGGGGAGAARSLSRLPDPSKLPKASGSGFLSFTKLPLSPQRGGRVRKGLSLDLEISYPPVGFDSDFDVDLNELTKELRVSLPASCPGPGPLFHHNNNFALKNSFWESMDTSASSDVGAGSRSRAGSAGTGGSNSPVIKDGGSNLQVHQNSKYIIFRDKTDVMSDSQHIQWEAMSNTEDSYVQFMRRHTCYDLIPTSSKLVVFDTALIVRRAFFGLVYNGVRAAPLWDSRKQEFVGMLTITDFIRILRHYYRSSSIPIEELENQRIQQWREVIHDEDRELIRVSPEDTLYNAVKKLVTHKVHRLPIIDPLTGNALHILTHKRILKYLSLYISDMPHPKYMSKNIKELGVGTFKEVATVRADTTLIKALNMFLDQRVSAMPVVDEQNKLVDIYAKFDVINLAARQTYNNLEITVEEALSYRKDRFEGVASCMESDTMEDVVKKIVHAGVHRLVMVDKENHVVGIVSLSDILGFIVMGTGQCRQPPSPGAKKTETMESECPAGAAGGTT